MIFVTVGTQLPFDRLVRAVDVWAGKHPRVAVFGQIADPGPRGHVPRNFEWKPHLDPVEFERQFAEAALIVAHAGMGTILGALTVPKPILILPRKAALGEQRNDHQLSTARRFSHRPGLTACMDEGEIGPALDSLISNVDLAAVGPIGSDASEELIAALRDFICAG